MPKPAVITLLSDFGLRDPYVAEMKAVIISICPTAIIVDISHEIKKFDIRMGAFVLAESAPYFPEGTIHVAVVDPGVGTKRRPIIIETKQSIYVGPDNGLLMLSAQREKIKHVYEIANPKYMRKDVSDTFHGRDIFSPVAAHLAKGIAASDLGPEICDPVVPGFVKPVVLNSEIEGEFIHIDDFGNLVSNITLRDLEEIGTKKGEKIRLKWRGFTWHATCHHRKRGLSRNFRKPRRCVSIF
ncbi:MAG: SAM-dependent chlorinase/fluorinase [Candidatus Bathyarchaeia archaeon]